MFYEVSLSLFCVFWKKKKGGGGGGGVLAGLRFRLNFPKLPACTLMEFESYFAKGIRSQFGMPLCKFFFRCCSCCCCYILLTCISRPIIECVWPNLKCSYFLETKCIYKHMFIFLFLFISPFLRPPMSVCLCLCLCVSLCPSVSLSRCLSVTTLIVAADIDSGAYLIPSAEPSVVRLTVRLSTFFFKSNRLPQFSSYFSDIWLECAHQYCARISTFFQWIFNYKKKYVKNGNIRGFWSYSQTVFNMTPRNLLYWYIVGTFRCVCEKMVLAGQICGPFFTPNNQNNSMYRFSPIFLKISHRIHTKLGL